MEVIAGMIVGAGALWLWQHRPRRSAGRTAVRASAEQEKLLHEYRNFLNYNGEQQEEYHGTL